MNRIETILVSAVLALLLFGRSLASVNSDQPIHLPYIAYDKIPEPGAKDIPITTTISITFSRPPEIVELELEPKVEISNIKKEIVGVASGRYTFYLGKPLQPETTYKVKVTYGQKEAPLSFTTWEFTTQKSTSAIWLYIIIVAAIISICTIYVIIKKINF